MTPPNPDIPGPPPVSPGHDSTDIPLTSIEPPLEPPQQVDQGLVFHASFTKPERVAALALLVGLDAEIQQQIVDEVAGNFILAPERTIRMRLLRFLVRSAHAGMFTPELCFSIMSARSKETSASHCGSKKAVNMPRREDARRYLESIRCMIGQKKTSKQKRT